MADPFTVTAGDLGRAESWVRRHGGPLPPSRLVTARIALRNASRTWELVLILVCASAIVGWALLAELIDFSLTFGSGTSMRGPVEMAVIYLLMASATWWTVRRQRSTEQRLAEALPRRATHSERRGALAILAERRGPVSVGSRAGSLGVVK